jgi:hypothetical protein
MQSTTSKTSVKTKKVCGSDFEFELKFIPCPPEQRESYWQAMRILNEMILRAIAEQQLALSDQLLEEPSQVNNGTEPVKPQEPSAMPLGETNF